MQIAAVAAWEVPTAEEEGDVLSDAERVASCAAAAQQVLLEFASMGTKPVHRLALSSHDGRGSVDDIGGAFTSLIMVVLQYAEYHMITLTAKNLEPRSNFGDQPFLQIPRHLFDLQEKRGCSASCRGFGSQPPRHTMTSCLPSPQLSQL